MPMRDDDSDNAIFSWQTSCPINNVTTANESQPRNKQSSLTKSKNQSTPLKEFEITPSSFEDEWEDAISGGGGTGKNRRNNVR